MKKMSIKKWIAILLKVLLAVVVLFFLGSESLNFFTFVFPAEQWYMAYTGFGLTSGAMIVYLYLFLYDAETSLQKTVALIMVGVGIIGELLTAGFGMQITGSANSGFAFTESDLSFMIMAVRILMFAHAGALIFYFAGDKVVQAFQDDDKDGIPNAFDRHDNRHDRNRQQNQNRPQQPRREFAEDEASVSNLAKNTAKNESGAEKGDNAHANGNQPPK